MGFKIDSSTGKHLIKEVLKSGYEALCRPDTAVNHSISNSFNRKRQESSPRESPSFWGWFCLINWCPVGMIEAEEWTKDPESPKTQSWISGQLHVLQMRRAKNLVQDLHFRM